MAIHMKAISFRTPSSKLKRIDELAGSQNRDRTFILNEAIDRYLEMHDYHASLVQEGLRDAEAGRVVPHEEVGRALAAQRAARKAKEAR
ncbi:MAG TPA: hypothetical protein VHB45_03185 [Alloacidobacterium sp.]|nr:hypothetical protein [Alloacidobacterium sp.]